MKVVQVLRDGSMDETDVSDMKHLSNGLVKSSKSQGSSSFKELYAWTYCDSLVKCFGWYDGEAGFENKHDLPPGGTSRFLEEDSSVQLLFGDLFLVRFQGETICEFDIAEYGEFYNLLFGGFDDCDSSDESAESGNDYTSEDGDYVPDEDKDEDDNKDDDNKDDDAELGDDDLDDDELNAELSDEDEDEDEDEDDDEDEDEEDDYDTGASELEEDLTDY
jgi:hypothetical protein